jgi:hypothetical protein
VLGFLIVRTDTKKVLGHAWGADRNLACMAYANAYRREGITRFNITGYRVPDLDGKPRPGAPCGLRRGTKRRRGAA